MIFSARRARVRRRGRRRALAVAITIGLAALMVGPSLPAAALAPVAGSSPLLLPDVEGSIGDSISSGYSLTGGAASNWSTGTSTTVKSILQRTQTKRGTSVTPLRAAVAKRSSSDLANQASTVIAGGAKETTILIGANDLCTATVNQMTSVVTFRNNVSEALTKLQGAGVAVVFASLPNINGLLTTFAGNAAAQQSWAANKTCPSLLANPASTDQADIDRRAAVAQRAEDYDAAIQAECAARSLCSYDGGATHAIPMTAADISTVDYFHPNASGHTKIADAVWPAFTAIYPGVFAVTAPDTTKPSNIVITAPATNSAVSGRVTLTATATDDVAVTKVVFYNTQSNVTVGTAALAGGVWSAGLDTTTLADGTVNIKAKAYDAAGNLGYSAKSVNLVVNNAPKPDMTAPTTLITGPASVPTVSGVVTLTATATDDVGVTAVRFVADDGSLMATASLAGGVWSARYDTTALTDGSHAFTARASDAAGNVGTSTPSTLAVSNAPPPSAPDTTAPTVAISAPSAGTTVTGTTALTATATDDVGVTAVTFVAGDGSTLATATFADGIWSAPFDSRTLSDGAHDFTARASDAAGNVGTSTPSTIVVDNAPAPDTTAPIATITAPASGSSVSGRITLSATASDDVGVTAATFFADGSPVVTAILTGGFWSALYDTTVLTSGPHEFTARAYDAAGNIGTSAPASLMVTNAPPPDTTAPIPAITAPASGSSASGTITLSATATDDVGVTAVTFLADGSLVATATLTGGVWYAQYDTRALADGSHAFTARAYDAAGNIGTSAPARVVVTNAPPPDTTAPTAAITAPNSGSSVSGTITLSATASDDVGVTAVTFFADGSPVVTATLAGGVWSAPYDTKVLTNGSHDFTARAYDAAGNAGTSAPTKLVVNNAPPVDKTAPTATVTSPATGSVVSAVVTLQATATDDVGVKSVKFYTATGGVLVGTATQSGGVWSYKLKTTTYANGPFSFKARAYDAAGNVGYSPTITITVAN